MTPEKIANRISEYLVLGGFFNPEAMDHDKVRDMLIDARNELTRLTRERDEAFNAGIEAAAVKSDHYAIKAQYRAASHDNPVARNAAWDKNEAGREIAIEIRALKKPATGQATGEK